MAFEINSGRISRAQKVCIYGVEGIGKSTFAAQFPGALFIDTEGSTGNMDVRRLPKPTSWQMLGEEMNEVLNGRLCKTLIIDTIDWAENLCIEYILGKYQKNGIEDFGYGNGYVYEKEEFSRFLNRTEDLISAGINIVLNAHAQLRKFSQPDEIGEYDRYELKLGKKTGSQISPLVKEWADILLFANYKTMAVAVDKDAKKFKAQGNARVMYTEHHPCWDAKNRHGLPAELPFDFSHIAHLFPADAAPAAVTPPNAAQITAPATAETVTEKICTPPTGKESTPKYWSDGSSTFTTSGEKPQAEKELFEIDKNDFEKLSAVKKLSDLMEHAGVTENEIRRVVAQRGYFPENTPIRNYPNDFISGVLVAAWEQVFAMIKQNRENDDMPF